MKDIIHCKRECSVDQIFPFPSTDLPFLVAFSRYGFGDSLKSDAAAFWSTVSCWEPNGFADCQVEPVDTPRYCIMGGPKQPQGGGSGPEFNIQPQVQREEREPYS